MVRRRVAGRRVLAPVPAQAGMQAALPGLVLVLVPEEMDLRREILTIHRRVRDRPGKAARPAPNFPRIARRDWRRP